MNNARKLTLLENAIKRLGEDARQRMAAADFAYKGMLSEEMDDLNAWLNDLNSGPDQREE